MFAPKNTPDREAEVTVVAREAISYFLDKAGLTSIPSIPRDQELEDFVDVTLTAWGLKEMVHPQDVNGTMLAEAAYAHIPNRRTRAHIALYTVLMLACDNPAVLNALDFDQFHVNFCSGAIQRSDTPGMFGRLSQLCVEMWEHYPRFSASAILAATLQYMNANILENMSGDILSTFKSESFLKYRRFADGVGEGFAALIWDKETFPDATAFAQALPDTMYFINFTNDILSFYKEELEEGPGNYIQDRAVANNVTVEQTIYELIDEIAASMDRVRALLGESKARDAFESFALGYVAFHVGCPRYRLKDVIDSKYIDS